MMKPILFNTEEVKAILDDRKSATRRAVPSRILDNYHNYEEWFKSFKLGAKVYEREFFMYDTPYQIDDILYVPEEWKYFTTFNPLGYDVEFRDGESLYFEFTDSRRAMEWKEYFDQSENQWQSLYFMPCEAARIFLRVTDVRVERLQDITPAGCVKEGLSNDIINQYETKDFPMIFGKAIWNRRIKSKSLVIYGWYANPWVWVIEFERISKEEAYKRCNNNDRGSI